MAHLKSLVEPLSTSGVESIVEWAAEKLPNDNDVIYIRRKNDRLFWTEGNKMGGTEWREINGAGVLPTGLKQQIVDIDNIEVPAEKTAVPKIDLGWYQNEKADLFYYEGGNIWRGIDPMRAPVLTDGAISGKLEFIG